MLYIGFLYVDVITTGNYALSRYLKYASIWLCFLLALFLWKNSTHQADNFFVCVALVFTLVADYFLLFTSRHELGVFFFCLVQLVYLRRLGAKNFKLSIYLAVAVFVFVALTTNDFNLYVLATLYAYLIASHLVATCVTPLPKVNRTILQVALVLFILCDIHVALLNLLPTNHGYYPFTVIATWLFYLPSQLLLVLSSRGNDFSSLARETLRKL